MKHVTKLLIAGLIITFSISCDKDDDTEVALYSYNDASKMVVQTVTTNVGTGLNDLCAEWFTDSTTMAGFCHDFTHASRFMDDNSGYLFVESIHGFNIAHPENPQLEGTSTLNQTDANGKLIVQEMIDMVVHTGFGFLEYNFGNPTTGSVEPKTTFVKSIPEANWYLGSGFYHKDGGLLSAEEVNEMIVKQAVESMAGGLGQILETHASDSLQGVELMRDFLRYIRFFDDHSGYFYVIDFNGYNVVQPPDPSIQGTYEWDIQDSRGNYLVRGLVETAQNGGGYYAYYWEDYEAGTEKLKKAYVKQIPGIDYLIGSGVYSAN